MVSLDVVSKVDFEFVDRTSTIVVDTLCQLEFQFFKTLELGVLPQSLFSYLANVTVTETLVSVAVSPTNVFGRM